MTNLWSAETRIGPLRFQAGCCRRRLNLALAFLCLFYVVLHFFWLVNVCFCCVRFSFSIPSKGLAWGCFLNDLFCVEWGIKPQLSQSVKQVCVFGCMHTCVLCHPHIVLMPIILRGSFPWQVDEENQGKLAKPSSPGEVGIVIIKCIQWKLKGRMTLVFHDSCVMLSNVDI